MFGNEGKETITEDVKSLIFYFQQLPAHSSYLALQHFQNISSSDKGLTSLWEELWVDLLEALFINNPTRAFLSNRKVYIVH